MSAGAEGDNVRAPEGYGFGKVSGLALAHSVITQQNLTVRSERGGTLRRASL
jgi:hypothetical protein